MKVLTVILGVLLCLLAVQARHYTDRSENEKLSNDELTETVGAERDFRASQMRHRRKRWNMNFDYLPPSYGYYPDRRDYDRNQELIPQILRLLDEIAVYVKRPPPPPIPPQPIYVPYPVPYPVPQNCTCNIKVVTTPNVTNRFPAMEDPNQNWGINTNEESEEDDGTDGARPISFEPIKPKRPMQRPPPEVEHGSAQAASNVYTTQAPNERTATRSAGVCNAAILSCCSTTNTQQKECFTKMGCSMTYAKGNACTSDSIATAIESFRIAYSPS